MWSKTIKVRRQSETWRNVFAGSILMAVICSLATAEEKKQSDDQPFSDNEMVFNSLDVGIIAAPGDKNGTQLSGNLLSLEIERTQYGAGSRPGLVSQLHYDLSAFFGAHGAHTAPPKSARPDGTIAATIDAGVGGSLGYGQSYLKLNSYCQMLGYGELKGNYSMDLSDTKVSVVPFKLVCSPNRSLVVEVYTGGNWHRVSGEKEAPMGLGSSRELASESGVKVSGKYGVSSLTFQKAIFGQQVEGVNPIPTLSADARLKVFRFGEPDENRSLGVGVNATAGDQCPMKICAATLQIGVIR